jgi:branched-chain amino acid transport system ATP-binding protein
VSAVEPEPRASTASVPLLELRDVDAAYGPYRALFGVSFSVPDHAAVALLGSNGAGKSTVARVVSGLVPATGGAVRFGGEDITRWPAWRIARAGLAHAPEGRAVFATLTVEENLVLTFGRAVGRRRVAEVLERAYGAFGRLRERRHQAAGTLSGGEQRMLALAKVLALPQRLLVVDELSLGLAPVVVDEVYGALRTILDAGTALLIVEQHVDRALALADHVVLLAKGKVVRSGPVSEVGRDVSALLPSRSAQAGRPGRRPGGESAPRSGATEGGQPPGRGPDE